MSCSYDLSTTHPVLNSETVERRLGSNLVLQVQSPSTGRALKHIWDIQTALEHGAVPAAQVVILDAINTAEANNTPLRISLTYDAL